KAITETPETAEIAPPEPTEDASEFLGKLREGVQVMKQAVLEDAVSRPAPKESSDSEETRPGIPPPLVATGESQDAVALFSSAPSTPTRARRKRSHKSMSQSVSGMDVFANVSASLPTSGTSSPMDKPSLRRVSTTPLTTVGKEFPFTGSSEEDLNKHVQPSDYIAMAREAPATQPETPQESRSISEESEQ